jgi:tetraacyldisaccharide-1-P 4'-kinase
LEANDICKRLYIDNHRFANNELEWINERSQEVDFLLTTEKDAV